MCFSIVSSSAPDAFFEDFGPGLANSPGCHQHPAVWAGLTSFLCAFTSFRLTSVLPLFTASQSVLELSGVPTGL